MKQITPASDAQIEKGMQPWKAKTLAVGGALGALVGLAGAFLLVKNAEKRNIQQLSISTSEGFRIGVLVIGLLRQISSIYED